ncbi:unnamed protein product, partial [Chrysoparadoxa australica]
GNLFNLGAATPDGGTSRRRLSGTVGSGAGTPSSYLFRSSPFSMGGGEVIPYIATAARKSSVFEQDMDDHPPPTRSALDQEQVPYGGRRVSSSSATHYMDDAPPPTTSLLDGGLQQSMAERYGSRPGLGAGSSAPSAVPAGSLGLRQRKDANGMAMGGRQRLGLAGAGGIGTGVGSTEFGFQTMSNADPWENWVVVYGFPGDRMEAVFREFRQYGQVAAHKIGQGNWMFIRYTTRLQAEKAFASGNGLVIGGGIMLGVRKMDSEVASQLAFDGQPSTIGGPYAQSTQGWGRGEYSSETRGKGHPSRGNGLSTAEVKKKKHARPSSFTFHSISIDLTPRGVQGMLRRGPAHKGMVDDSDVVC